MLPMSKKHVTWRTRFAPASISNPMSEADIREDDPNCDIEEEELGGAIDFQKVLV